MTYRNNNLTTNTYGCVETNGLNGGPNVEERGAQAGKPSRDSVDHIDDGRPYWAQPDFKRFVRIRLLSDPGYPVWDLSYAYGEWIDGSIQRINFVPGMNGYGQFPKRKWKTNAVNEAKQWGVYLKRLEFFDAISTLC